MKGNSNDGTPRAEHAELQPSPSLVDDNRASNTVLGRFIIPELRSSPEWVELDARGREFTSATEVLRLVNENHPTIRVDPRVLGGRLALGADNLQGALWGDHEAEVVSHLDRAALLYSSLIPEKLPADADSQSRLSAVRQTFMDALAREWRKANLFQHRLPDQEEQATPWFNGFTMVNARGKTIKDIAEDPALKRMPGMEALGDPERAQLLVEWAREKGLDSQHKIGTIEFSLASVLAQRAINRGEQPPAEITDTSTLAKVFDQEVKHWQENPEYSFNPVVLVAFHLAQSSGDRLEGSAENMLAQAISTLSERWNANFGKPPVFSREVIALDILEEITGQDRDHLEWKAMAFTSHHPFGLTESVYSTPLERFLLLADRPGVGHSLTLPCDHLEHHNSHLINPRQVLQDRENQHNLALPNHPWVLARAKENLRLAEKDLSEENLKGEVIRIVQNYSAETESHRHLISGLHFLKDWYISQIPVVGGIYNIEEGIRYHQIKQIVGGGLALTFEVGGIAFSLRRGGMSAEAGGGAVHQIEAADALPTIGSAEHSHSPGVTASAQPNPAGDLLGAARPLKPRDKAYIYDPVHGLVLKTRFEGLDNEIAWVGAGGPGAFRAIDLQTGVSLTTKIYDMDAATGTLVPRIGLKGGGQCCAKVPELTEVVPGMEDVPYAPRDRVGIREPFASDALEPRDDAPRVTGRKEANNDVGNRNRADSAVTAREASESFSSGAPSSSDVGDYTSIDLDTWTNPSGEPEAMNKSFTPAPFEAGADVSRRASSTESASSESTVIERGNAAAAAQAVLEDGGSPADAAVLSQQMPVLAKPGEGASTSRSFSDYFRLPPLKSLPQRIGELADNAKLAIIPDENTDAGGKIYLIDQAKIDPDAKGLTGPIDESLVSEPLEMNGPTAETVRQDGRYMGDDLLGRSYFFKGRYWSLLIPDEDAPPSARAKAAAQAWNSSYHQYGIGRATAHDLGDGTFAISMPPIPLKEGFGRAHNLPQGRYAPPTSLDPLPIPEAGKPVSPKLLAGEIADRLVVSTGGHRIEDNVYWYGDEYWTFQSGATLQERYWNGLQFARDWDQTVGEATGSRAVVKILPGDRSVVVLTKAVPDDIPDAPQLELALSERTLADPHDVSSEVPPQFLDIRPGEDRVYVHPITGETLTVTRTAEEDAVLVLKSFSEGGFHAVDWATGQPRQGAEPPHYHVDPNTGQIRPGDKHVDGEPTGRALTRNGGSGDKVENARHEAPAADAPLPVERANAPVDHESAVSGSGAGLSRHGSIFDRLGGFKHKFNQKLLQRVKELVEENDPEPTEFHSTQTSSAAEGGTEQIGNDASQSGWMI